MFRRTGKLKQKILCPRQLQKKKIRRQERKKHRAEKESETSDEQSDTDATPKRSELPLFIGGTLLLIGAVFGLIYWLNARHFESTDDAFIDSDIIQISPKVSAYVTKIYVKSNQHVHKGDLLVELNTKDYEAKLEQAQAQLRAAQAQKNQSQAQVALTRVTTERQPNAGAVERCRREK